MGYIFWSIALFCGQVKGFFGKKISGTVSEPESTIVVNILRMGVCTFIGFLIVVMKDCFSMDRYLLATAFLGGVSNAVFVVSWLICAGKDAYMLVNVFTAMGCILPLILSDLFFQEEIVLRQWAGIALMVVAAWIMCTYSSRLKGRKMTCGALVTLLICGLSDGASSFSQKCFQMFCVSPQTRYADYSLDVSMYNMCSYFASAIILMLCLWALHRRRRTEKREKNAFSPQMIAYVCIMSVCLFGYSYFMVLAAGKLSAAQLYPMTQGAGLLLSSLMAMLFYGEKITGKCVLGMALTLCSMLLINC